MTRSDYRKILLLVFLFCFLTGSSAYADGAIRQYYVAFNTYAAQAEDLVSKGAYPQALEMYGKASALYAEKNNELGVLFCLERMGWLKRELGEYGQALELFRKAHPIGVRLNGDAAEIDANLGDVYMFSGDTGNAEKYYLQALDTLKSFVFEISFDDLPGKRELFEIFRKCKAIIHARCSLGILHYFAGEYEEVLKQLDQAGGLINKIKKVCGDPTYGAYFKLDSDMYNAFGYRETLLGAVYGERGEIETARQHYRAGYQSFQEGERSFGMLFNDALRLKTELRSRRAVLDSAELEKYDDFLNKAGAFGAADIVWRVCYEIGRELVKEKQYLPARAYLAQAVDTLELTRSRLREDTIKKMFAASVQDVYAQMIELLFEMNDVEAGFDYLERAKGRAFLDIIAGRSLKAKKTVDAGLIKKEREVSVRIEEILRSLDNTTGSKRDASAREYKSLLSEHRAVLDSIKNQSLEFAATSAVAVVPAKQLVNRLGEEEALVSYYLSDNRIIVWTVRRSGIKAVPVDISSLSLAGLVRDYRKAVAGQQSARILALGGQLYEVLIAPVTKDLAGAKNMFIVPTGILHYLPFAALNGSADHFLIQDFALTMLPNAASLFHLDKEVTADRDHLLAVGNPRLQDPRFSLPFTEEEIRVIGKNFPQSRVLTGADARESVFREKDIVDTGVIHIAAHGTYNARDPLKSAILLAGDDTCDGNLETVEIYSLTMNPRLVVLSACQSGVGAVENGDEVQSLNRAFLYAGAGSVVASLWNVNDKATAAFMQEFYKNLEGMDTAQALRAAQLQFLKIRDYRSPYYWAAFYLMGGRR